MLQGMPRPRIFIGTIADTALRQSTTWHTGQFRGRPLSIDFRRMLPRWSSPVARPAWCRHTKGSWAVVPFRMVSLRGATMEPGDAPLAARSSANVRAAGGRRAVRTGSGGVADDSRSDQACVLRRRHARASARQLLKPGQASSNAHSGCLQRSVFKKAARASPNEVGPDPQTGEQVRVGLVLSGAAHQASRPGRTPFGRRA